MAKQKQKKSIDELNTENEFMKLKMMAEFGGDFIGSDNIPPDVENQFLKQIISFHKLHDHSKVTTVYKYIGKPAYNHVNDLSNKEVVRDLKSMMNLMERRGVALSVLDETPPREIYRFITEELFKHEIEDVKIKGWLNQFVYEEFYPNINYDVRNAAVTCIESIFNKNVVIPKEYFSENLKDSIGLSIELDDLVEKIKKFQALQHQLKIVKYDLKRVEIDAENQTAYVAAEVAYKTQTAKGKRFRTQNNFIELYLQQNKYMETWWEIKQVITDLL